MKYCLVVDDVPDNLYITEKMLRAMGLKTIAVSSGERALSHCLLDMPTAILLDISMPEMNGFQFLHKLHSIGGGRAVKVIMCTAHADIVNVKEAMRLGVSGFIAKPFKRTVLQSHLERLSILKH
ncbi:MAG: response regulator [Proteobacteria bacterium]|nr:response regulator [Pseudomonadota bacterium]